MRCVGGEGRGKEGGKREGRWGMREEGREGGKEVIAFIWSWYNAGASKARC